MSDKEDISSIAQMVGTVRDFSLQAHNTESISYRISLLANQAELPLARLTLHNQRLEITISREFRTLSLLKYLDLQDETITQKTDEMTVGMMVKANLHDALTTLAELIAAIDYGEPIHEKK